MFVNNFSLRLCILLSLCIPLFALFGGFTPVASRARVTSVSACSLKTVTISKTLGCALHLLCQPSKWLFVLGMCTSSSNTFHKVGGNGPTNNVSSKYLLNSLIPI